MSASASSPRTTSSPSTTPSTNDSAVQVLGDETLRTIARELVARRLEQAEVLSEGWSAA